MTYSDAEAMKLDDRTFSLRIANTYTVGVICILMQIAVLAMPGFLVADGGANSRIAPAPAVSNIRSRRTKCSSGQTRAKLPGLAMWRFFAAAGQFRSLVGRKAVRPLTSGAPTLQMELESVILGTLRFSPQVCVMREVSPIHEESVVEAEADFDPKALSNRNFSTPATP